MNTADSESGLHKDRSRKGLATVELAVCLPVLLILVFGSIECTSAIFLKQRLQAAAYEGARKVIVPGKVSQDAVNAAGNVLIQFGITSNYSVTATQASGTASGGTVSATTPTGTLINVTVSAPFSSHSCIKPFIIGNAIGTISATTVMIHQ